MSHPRPLSEEEVPTARALWLHPTDAGRALRAQERLRSLLIAHPWYAEQDKCFGMEFWRALLWQILSAGDPPIDQALTAREPIQECARRASRIPPDRPNDWKLSPPWPTDEKPAERSASSMAEWLRSTREETARQMGVKHSPERRERARRLRAARRLRRALISIPWYAERDAESGMSFWLTYHASQINTN